jgi:hypothetical protein
MIERPSYITIKQQNPSTSWSVVLAVSMHVLTLRCSLHCNSCSGPSHRAAVERSGTEDECVAVALLTDLQAFPRVLLHVDWRFNHVVAHLQREDLRGLNLDRKSAVPVTDSRKLDGTSGIFEISRNVNWQEHVENYVIRNFVICSKSATHRILGPYRMIGEESATDGAWWKVQLATNTGR